MTRCLLQMTFAFSVFYVVSAQMTGLFFSSIVFVILFHYSIPLPFNLSLSQAG